MDPLVSRASFQLDEPGVRRLAEVLAWKLRPGDVVALRGDLGAGKTTLARALIRALLEEPGAEVPSPTYSIMQSYMTPRVKLAHFDFYRLSDGRELDEIGFDDALRTCVVLVEWPERAEFLLPPDRIEIALAAVPGSANLRTVTLQSAGSTGSHVRRIELILAFVLRHTDADKGQLTYLQGDASPRAYASLAGGPRPAIVMDAPRQPDGPPVRDGKTYSQIAHLAEDVRPFIAVAHALSAAGLSVPQIYAAEPEHGLLLLEDLGARVFGREVKSHTLQPVLWRAAVDALLHLRRQAPATTIEVPSAGSGAAAHTLPRFDRAGLEIETELLLDWYWPAVMGNAPPRDAVESFRALWAPVFDRMLAEPAGWFLRDYHSPNLIWLPDREGYKRVGVIDFQDALAEPWAYDLVSLLQDARVDVPAALERELLDYYCGEVAKFETGFDAAAFARTYATFGAQRNTRLVGLWVRLLKRDGKPAYLAHMPRTWTYLVRNLAHPSLADLKQWFDTHIPSAARDRAVRG